MSKNGQNGQKWLLLGPQMVNMITGIQTANALTEDGQKWPNIWKNWEKLPKMAIFGS